MRGAETVGLTVRFGSVCALRDVSLVFGEGVTAVLGVNGCGKSTLLRSLATTQRPTAGRVIVDGADLASSGMALERARRNLGYLDQRPRFPGAYTVTQAVEYAAWLHQVPRRDRAARVSAAIEASDLGQSRHRRLSTLSGGTRQRVAIAQATVHLPRLLVLDEPSAGLDLDQRHLLRATIARVAATTTVVMSTHDVDDVLELADRIVVLVDGSVAADGTADELLPSQAREQAESRLRSLMAPS